MTIGNGGGHSPRHCERAYMRKSYLPEDEGEGVNATRLDLTCFTRAWFYAICLT